MAFARELSIVYGALTIGGANTSNLLTDRYRITQEPTLTRIEFDFLVVGSSEAAFATAVAAAEAEFRKPYLNCTITLGGQTLLSLSQSGNTGLDARPSLSKVGKEEDNARTRRYSAVLQYGRPADYASTVGLRESSVNIAYSPSRRRTITISGTFTAITTNDARAQHDAKIATYASSILSSYASGGTFELAEEPTTEHDTNDKLIRFVRVYDEIIFGQAASGTTNDTDIVRQSLQITRSEANPGFSPPAHPLVRLTGRYDCYIDSTATKDLRAKWASIRTWVIEQLQNTLGGETIALVREEPNYDYDDNRITVTVEVLGQSSIESTNTLAREITTEDREVVGRVLVPIWTGRPFDRYRYQGPATLRRTVRETTTVIGGNDEPSLRIAALSPAGAVGVLPPTAQSTQNSSSSGQGAQFTFPGASAGSGSAVGSMGVGVGDDKNWDLVEQSENATPRMIGFDGRTISVTDYTRTSVYEHYTEPPETS